MRKLFIFVVFVCMLSSCVSVETISIDYLTPAKVSFPSELETVAIVNNTSQLQHRDSLLDKSVFKQPYLTDQSTQQLNGNGKLVAEALAENLANQSYFETVVICDSALQLNTNSSSSKYLTPQEIQQLTNEMKVDFIISIEDIQIQSKNRMYYYPEIGQYYSTIDAKVNPLICIYVPQKTKPLFTLSPTDSIYWENFGYSEGYVTSTLIDKNRIIEEASSFAGDMIIKYILPTWKTVERKLCTRGSVYMRDAAIYAREGNWEQACQLWKDEYRLNKSAIKRMYAAQNIALAYEMKDNIKQALEWAVKAQTIAYKVENIDKVTHTDINITDVENYVMTSLYIKELKQREKEMTLLNIQMQRLNENTTEE